MSVLCVLDLFCDGQTVSAQRHIGPDGLLRSFSSTNSFFVFVFVFAVVGLKPLVCNSHTLNFSNDISAPP